MKNTGEKNRMLIIAAGVAIVGGLVVYLGYSYLGNEKSVENKSENNDGGNVVADLLSSVTGIKEVVKEIDGNEGILKSQAEGNLMKQMLKSVFNQNSDTTSP
tara:strand:+ start:1662 stop:1967 length:306 start_codon:yes stop_codon:yes gene_type:complete